VTESKVI